MIKPISGVNKINIEPIKVPHKNNISFGNFSVSKIKDVSENALNGGFAKKIAGYAKKAIDFVSEKFTKLWNFISEKVSNAKDVTKNPAKKTKTLRNIALGVGATAGATAGVGAGAGGIKRAKANKK